MIILNNINTDINEHLQIRLNKLPLGYFDDQYLVNFVDK